MKSSVCVSAYRGVYPNDTYRQLVTYAVVLSIVTEILLKRSYVNFINLLDITYLKANLDKLTQVLYCTLT